MPTNILMPALSPTMEKGNLAKWIKKEGDKVAPGDVLAEIETDKATMEVEAVDEGTLAKIVVPEGTQDVPVNQVIAVLAGEGEDVKAAASTAAAAGKPEQRTSAETPSPQPSPPRGDGAGSASPQGKAPSPLPGGERSAPKAPGEGVPAQRATEPSPHRSPSGLPRKAISTLRACKAPVRTAASSPAISRRRNRAVA